MAFQFLPRAAGVFCMGFTLLASAAFDLVPGWWSWGDAVRSCAIGEVMMGATPVSIWPSRFFMPISLILAGVACVLMFASPPQARSAR